jgi:hypothetical protein
MRGVERSVQAWNRESDAREAVILSNAAQLVNNNNSIGIVILREFVRFTFVNLTFCLMSYSLNSHFCKVEQWNGDPLFRQTNVVSHR